MVIKLHPGQKRIWEEIKEAQEKGSRHFVCNAPRQWGKSFFFVNLAILYGVKEVGAYERNYDIL